LNSKFDDTGGTINGNVNITGDLVIGTTNIIDEIGTKQDSIQDGDLTIANTNGLQTALDAKQDEITTPTDLSCNSINVSDKYFYTLNSVNKPIGLYGGTLHYYQVEDDLDTFINSTDINEGDTILFSKW